MEVKTVIAVGVAIINKDKKVLIAKRKEDKPMPHKWEFPGGKLEVDETLQACGIREIKEELSLDIRINDYLGFEDIHYENRDFCLHLYSARLIDETQPFILHEHTDARWVDCKEFDRYDFPASKLAFTDALKKMLSK